MVRCDLLTKLDDRGVGIEQIGLNTIEVFDQIAFDYFSKPSSVA
jgi:hypothetical protein